jgi:hypothetical protein
MKNTTPLNACGSEVSASERKTNAALTARINLRISQGWDLEKIGRLTVWRMYGHLYSIRNGVLTVKMSGGARTFGGGL